jgi:sugar phosphate isomerase/epimerase
MAAPTAEEARKLELTNPFFAFDNGAGRGKLPPATQAKMLAELGYDGIGYTGTGGIPAMLEALDGEGLKMFSTYVGATVGPQGPSYDPGLKHAIEQFKGRDVCLWLFIRGGKPSGDEHDEQAVAMVREIAAMAADAQLRVVLYPHVGFYVARVEDALRIAEKVDRENVGVAFNLCHFLKLDDEKNLEGLLGRAMPRLFLVSINGADGGDTIRMGWDRLIQTLDQGDFDVYLFLKALRRLGYDGPIGLQCYGIRGEPRENLRRSMAAWQDFVRRMADE